MSQPFLSGVTVTFGRVEFLQEAILCFLNQDYAPKELVVLNTCPLQRLSCEAEGVRVFNCDVRPASLGEARNIAIEKAAGTHILTIDDDDVILPHHFRTYAENFGEHDWIWLDKEFYSEGEEIRGIVQGSCPLFAFTKKAWAAVGGYAAMGVGEDRQFISRVTEKHVGRKVEIPGLPTYIYRWGQGTYHFSGKGEDPGAHKSIEDDLILRIQKGREPVGDIRLEPKVKLDWPAKASGWFAITHSKKNPGDDVAIVLLGRFGDIINALPIAKHIAENYGRPHWIVSREFASVFDGVSYVEPDVVDFKNHQIKEALAYARKTYRHVLRAQIWGSDWEQEKQCVSYNRESWRACGFLHKFDDRGWLPVFDRRDYAREAAFYRKTNPEGKPMLIVNVRRSVSSPFRFGGEVMDALRTAYPMLRIVDVADWELPHIYDMLGLMERAVAVVSIDTALLHLAAACEVPVVALTNPARWQGSEIRADELLRLTYADFDTARWEQSFFKVRTMIDQVLDAPFPRTTDWDGIIREAPQRTIFHVVERHEETNPKELNRKRRAWASWDVLYECGVIPVHVWKYPRNALAIGDPRPLPYWKDVLQAALDQANDDDIVFWTNDDDFIHADIPELLRYHVALYECCCSSRCEFHEVLPSASNKPEVFARNGRLHMGRDLFAATKRWWIQKWRDIGDPIIGASDFDLHLAALFRLHFGIKTTRSNLEQVLFPADLPRGYVSHQFHPPRWNTPENRDAAPSQVHNRQIFRNWAAKHLPELKFHANGTI